MTATTVQIGKNSKLSSPVLQDGKLCHCGDMFASPIPTIGSLVGSSKRIHRFNGARCDGEKKKG